jgi:hypothetical protein
MPFGTIKGAEMYASLRTYRIGSGSVDAVLRRVDRDFAEACRKNRGSSPTTPSIPATTGS